MLYSISIDKEGRIVVPVFIREALNFSPRSVAQLKVVDGVLELRAVNSNEYKQIDKEGRLQLPKFVRDKVGINRTSPIVIDVSDERVLLYPKNKIPKKE